MRVLTALNADADQYACFLGGGVYDHYIPSPINHLISRGEFFTAYTPYQPEASQGTLRTIYEYQTMIAELTGMDVANASIYDGANACGWDADQVARVEEAVVDEAGEDAQADRQQQDEHPLVGGHEGEGSAAARPSARRSPYRRGRGPMQRGSSAPSGARSSLCSRTHTVGSTSA